MRILIYGLNFAPELTGIGKFSGEMAHWLAGRGHEIRVITAPPYYPDWKVAKGYKAYAYALDKGFNFPVWRTPLWIPTRPGALKRLIHLASFGIFSFPKVLLQARWRPDVIISVAPTLFSAPATLALAKLSGAKTCLHIQDFEVDAAFGLGMLRAPNLEKLILRAEKWIYSKFDYVSTISRKMLAKLEEKNVAPSRTLFFPNWVDCNLIYPVKGNSSYRQELNIPDGMLVAMYSGAMGEKQGIELIVEAARRLAKRDSLIFVLAGAGSSRERLMAQTLDLKNVRWLPLQPLERLNDWLNLADIHLLPQRGDAADLVMPSKLTGMLASGRPVIATAAAGTQLAAMLDGVGRVVPPDSVEEFVAALEELTIDGELRQKMAANSRQYAMEHLDQVAVLSRFELDLEQMMAGGY